MNSGNSYRVSFGPPVTPRIIKRLMLANVAVFVAQIAIPNLTPAGVVSPDLVWIQRQIWRPFTYMWFHHISVLPLHLAMNMFMLWMFGSELALYWGEKRFLRYYLNCGFGAGFLIATVPFLPGLAGWPPWTEELTKTTLGASGAIMGVLLAFSFTWPYSTIRLIFPPIPLKAIWLIPFVFVMEFMTGSSNVSHLGHLGGVVVGWLYLIHEGKTPDAPTIETLKRRYRRWRTPTPPTNYPTASPSKPARPEPKLSLKRRYQRQKMRRKLRSVPGEARPEKDQNDD
ncbi:MAG: rhomboid family intramembrane serine protease [Deltaproteobacteria bacterium]|nr:rhomboid family intramembrane serine protease [Deltaproteobacteria bacterium]